MATVKIILRTTKTNAAGEAPLCLRIIQGRKTKFVYLKYSIRPECWDSVNSRVKKSHPNYQRLNNYIAQKFAEAQDVTLKIETGEKYTTSEHIKEQIMGKAPESFFKYADRHLVGLEVSGKIASYRKGKAILGKMKEYLKGRDLLFNQITVTWLKEYEMHMRKKLNNRTNTINSNFRNIRAIINFAINEDLIPEDKNPFRRFKLTTEKVKKDYLTEDELLLIEQVPLRKNSMMDHHRNMYVFSAYAGGLRISDVLMLKWKNFDGERIIVQTKKTSSTVSVKLPTKAMDILKIYQRENVQPEDFIFPILEKDQDYSDSRHLFNSISAATAYTNKDLRGIAKKLEIEKRVSFHSARHTFATRLIKHGVRIEHISKLLGHSSVAMTQVYANYQNEDLDDSMSVLGEPMMWEIDHN